MDHDVSPHQHEENLVCNELDKRIIEAFEIFDHSSNKTVDVREVGTILRALGCCPTEEEIQEILVRVEDHETSNVPLNKFLPYITQLITERKFQPATPEEILKAFRTLDLEGKGYLTKDYISRLLTEEGEPFTQEELAEFLMAAADLETGHIHYEFYINQLMVHAELPEWNIYSLIPPPVEKKNTNLAAILQSDFLKGNET